MVVPGAEGGCLSESDDEEDLLLDMADRGLLFKGETVAQWQNYRIDYEADRLGRLGLILRKLPVMDRDPF